MAAPRRISRRRAASPRPDLASLLRRHCVRSSSGRRFLPYGALRRLVCEESVRVELSKHPQLRGADLNDLTRRICGGSNCRVFALLVLVGLVPAVAQVLHPVTGISDSDLPLRRLKSRRGHVLRRRAGPDSDAPLSCFAGRKQRHLLDFYKCQWTVAAPVFPAPPARGRPAPHFDFPARTILPFREDGRDERRSGSSGEVTWVTVEPSHHGFSNDFAALKRLRSGSPEEFRREVRLLGVGVHPHLVGLWATWKHGPHYYLLFPRARCDLREYWEENPAPRLSPERMRWASKQILGLAGVLREMDGYGAEERSGGDRFAYHGDVKAENVLLFDDAAEPLGRLVLADVGSGGFSSPSDAPNKYRTTPYLKPPDYDVRGGSDPRSLDRWAFGCFLFDFVIWLLAGTGAIDDFEDERFSPDPLLGHRVDSQIYFDLREWRGGTALVIKEAVLNVHRRRPPSSGPVLLTRRYRSSQRCTPTRRAPLTCMSCWTSSKPRS